LRKIGQICSEYGWLQVGSHGFRYRIIGLSIAMVIFLGGTTVENTLHHYLLIALAYIISFYFVLSNIDRRSQKIYTEASMQ